MEERGRRKMERRKWKEDEEMNVEEEIGRKRRKEEGRGIKRKTEEGR